MSSIIKLCSLVDYKYTIMELSQPQGLKVDSKRGPWNYELNIIYIMHCHAVKKRTIYMTVHSPEFVLLMQLGTFHFARIEGTTSPMPSTVTREKKTAQNDIGCRALLM